MGLLTLFIGLFLFSMIGPFCTAKGVIKVQLVFYRNPDGKDKEGNCCDKNYGLFCKTDGCDHNFNICVDNKGAYGCTLGRIQTPAIQNQNVIEFTDKIGDMPNPLVFPVHGAVPKAIDIKIIVYDEDTGFNTRSNYVDLIKVRVENLTTNKDMTYTKTHRTTVDLHVWYECIEDCAEQTKGAISAQANTLSEEPGAVASNASARNHLPLYVILVILLYYTL